MSPSVTQRVEEFLKQNSILTKHDFLDHKFSDPNKKDVLWTLIPKTGNTFSDTYLHMLLYVRNLMKHMYEVVEGEDSIEQKTWSSSQTSGLSGGGIMTVMRGNVLEKSAVNLSVVSGEKYPGDEKSFAGKPFIAAGVSLISHPKNPFAPIVHFNIRMIKVFGDNETHQWIGGGADLTPMHVFEEDTQEFHNALKTVCQKHSNIANYDHFQKWADEYFYIPHRKEIRGVGGIFFDFLPVSSDADTLFLCDLGQYVAHVYAKILARRVDSTYTPEHVEKHQTWRGRYAEFNLIYDRGTRFGLMSGGNHEAIFCSLPPQVRW